MQQTKAQQAAVTMLIEAMTAIQSDTILSRTILDYVKDRPDFEYEALRKIATGLDRLVWDRMTP